MGQSDTESTSSSMRGNPGSPRDPSTLFEEVSIDTLSNPFSHAAAGSPSTSSDSSEMESVVIAGERPKSRQRDIPFIDLTSMDSNESESVGETSAGSQSDPASDVHEMYSEFAARVQRQLHAARERVARIRMEHTRMRSHAFRSRMQNCPYIATYRDGRRHSSIARQRAIELATAGTRSSVSPRPSVITITDSPVPISSSQNNLPGSSDASGIGEPSADAATEVFESPYHHMRPEQRFAWRRRHMLQRLQDRYSHGSCIQGSSDEAVARRLQAQYDQELAEEQQQSSASGDSSYIPHASPELAAGPMPSPVHARRIVRRGLLRRHNVGPHFAPASGLPDLLLPFVSVTSLPPPLHHFGEPGQNQNNENEDYEVLWNLSERIGPAKSRGLPKEVIDRIPSFRFSTKDCKEQSNGSCVVCMMDYTNREKLRRLPCSHDFHSKCIDRWLKSNRTCPICREMVSV